MPRLPLVDPAATTGPTRQLLDQVAQHTGHVPNALRVLASAPAALGAWWGLEQALARGTLRRGVREQLAVLAAATNDCDYCLTTHAAAARAAGVSDDDIRAAREATASDPHARAVLGFAADALARCGDVSDDTLARARAAGLTDEHLLDILAVLALNTFLNACNRLAHTPPDAGLPVDR